MPDERLRNLAKPPRLIARPVEATVEPFVDTLAQRHRHQERISRAIVFSLCRPAARFTRRWNATRSILQWRMALAH